MASFAHGVGDALVAEGPQVGRGEALRLQCSVSIAAAKLATKVGDASAAWSAAERARVSALEADDPFGRRRPDISLHVRFSSPAAQGS